MPRLTDKNEIRTLLRRDPAWSVYALGDLAPPMFPKTLWFAPDLTLVVQDYGTAILFAIGPGSVVQALACVTGPVHLQVQRDALDEVARHAAVSSSRLMWRMVWTGDRVLSPGALTTAWARATCRPSRPCMPMASPPSSRPTSSFRRWSMPVCSTGSMKARRW